MKNKLYFISDIHLGLQSKAQERVKEDLLEKLFKKIQEDGSRLVINGDLFDYWFEYRNVYQKGFFRTLTALQNLVESGAKVDYVIGNHDFYHRDFFEKEIGVNLIQNSLDLTFNEKKFFIAHGDGYVQNDFGYLILKSVLRNRFFQFLYSLIHPDFGVGLAKNTSKQSRDYTTKKEYGESDGLFKSASALIDEGYDFVVFGHLHQRQYLSHNNGMYINLGTWLERPCYGVFDGNVFKIIDWY